MTIKKSIENAKKENKLLIGSHLVLKKMKSGDLKSVFYSSNCPLEKLKDLNYYNSLTGVEVKEFDGTSKQLGELCGKPFNALMIGIKK